MEMVSSKPVRNAIVEEYPDAEAIHVVTQQLANLRRSLSVILATKTAALPPASSPQMARCAVLALVSAILRKSVVALQQLALPIPQLQMVTSPRYLFILATNSIQEHHVVAPLPAHPDSAHPVTSSVRL